ncbi:hypothetical protein [Legionella clemsonensis]|uniref:Uncharacterized protein n=1 Tax=Legionella clemsonensis TaxID=1867846 RepID=A0A222P033_9GAMM|nr:hypothetical protein [Legionella clemsonensis]ASQ45214.1 hypothetical protein clem_03280 [Legionella clemsonensis]
MIEVNVWMPTTKLFGKRIKSALGSFFSAAFNENAGHVNFLLTVPEGTAAFQKMEARHYDLTVEKSVMIVGQSFPEKPVLGLPSAGTLKFWQPQKIRVNGVTHSFWPAKSSKKSVFQDILYFMHLLPRAKGVPSEIASHEEDMEREALPKERFCIKHNVLLDSTGREKKGLTPLQKEKLKNQELAIKVNELEVALEKKEKLQQEIHHLISRKEDLLAQITDVEQAYSNKNSQQNDELYDQYEKLQQQEKFLLRKLSYLEKIENFDEQTLNEHLKLHEQLFTLRQQKSTIEMQTEVMEQLLRTENEQHQTNLNNLQSTLQLLLAEINAAQNSLNDLEAEILQGQTIGKITGLKALHKMQVDALQREENFRAQNKVTTGKMPDHTVKLPTKDSGLVFYVDEELVLEAMQDEQKKNYSFIHSNCAASAKRCLLAGIMPIKKQLISDAGFTEDDFIVHTPETCKSMRAWMKKLEGGLTKLNSAKRILESAADDHPYSSSSSLPGLC